jgi:hypothetical protein
MSRNLQWTGIRSSDIGKNLPSYQLPCGVGLAAAIAISSGVCVRTVLKLLSEKYVSGQEVS